MTNIQITMNQKEIKRSTKKVEKNGLITESESPFVFWTSYLEKYNDTLTSCWVV